jgi:hypothetical protein
MEQTKVVAYRYILHSFVSSFFYPQDPNYGISYIIWHFNTLIIKIHPKIKFSVPLFLI